jgi:Putative zinc-finger
MRGHVDTESLALYAEGLLSRRRSAQIRSHLPGCPACTATVRQLTGVSGLLGQVPAAPLPPGVAARLDAALAAETARQEPGLVTGTASAGGAAGAAPEGRTADGWSPGSPDAAVPSAGLPAIPPSSAPSAPAGPAGPAGHPAAPTAPTGPAGQRPGPGHAHRSRGPGRAGRWARRSTAGQRLAAAAGVLAVLAAGGYGLSRLAATPPGPSASSRAATALAPAALPTFSSHLDYQPHTLGQVAAQALREYRSTSGATAGTVTGGPAATIGSSASSGASGSTGPGKPGGAASRNGAAEAGPGMFSVAAATLQRCAATVAAGRRVELVDRASYAGQPAIIVVLAARGQTPAWVWVAGLGCRPGHPDRLAGAPLGG